MPSKNCFSGVLPAVLPVISLLIQLETASDQPARLASDRSSMFPGGEKTFSLEARTDIVFSNEADGIRSCWYFALSDLRSSPVQPRVQTGPARSRTSL